MCIAAGYQPVSVFQYLDGEGIATAFDSIDNFLFFSHFNYFPFLHQWYQVSVLRCLYNLAELVVHTCDAGVKLNLFDRMALRVEFDDAGRGAADCQHVMAGR